MRDPRTALHANLLLRSLAASDASLVAPFLKRTQFKAGERLPLSAVGSVYFPETIVACLGTLGRESGIALVGREGVIGADYLFGHAPNDHQAFVQLGGGSALVMSSRRFEALVLTSPSLALSLMRFLQSFTIQMSRTIRSNMHDSIEARLCGWLLMLHDRIEGDELVITHRSLACLLNVRRASVTDAMHVIEGERALRCTRGRITVRDRGQLERLAGTSYGAPELAYRSMVGPFGKSFARTATPPAAALAYA